MGQRTGMMDGSGGTAWSYDSRGRLVREVKTITGSGLFKTEYGYNRADQPAWMKYPADNAGNVGEQVTYGYNGQGTLNSLYSSTASYYYVPQTTYDAAGRMTKRLLGAANLGSAPVLTSSYYYQGWNVQGGRLRMVETKDSQNTLYQRLSYTYDPAGNITAILDGANSSQKQCFAYDNLYRLTSAKVGNNDANCSGTLGSGEYADETYAYDGTTGNLSSKTGMGSYTYDASHKHAVATTSAGGSFNYDATGNMTHRDLPDILDANTYDYTFDAENRLVQAKKNGSIVATLTYDGDGKRVKAVQGGTTTAFVGGYFEWSGSTSTIVKYYRAGGQTAAIRTGSGSGTSGLRFSLSDHLGSTMLTINADLSGRADQLYKPWGESRYASGTLGTKYTYTGQYSYATPSANDFGLLYYGARYYDPLVGRWAQPDSIIPQQSQGVQAWDRYAYVNNSATRWNDPSGHCIDGVSTALCIFVGAIIVGAVVGGAINAYQQYQETGRVNSNQVLGAALTGAVVGGGIVIAASAAMVGASVVGSALVAGACGDGDCGNEGMAATRALGQAGETASGIVKNTVHIESLTETAKYRIPDQLLPNQQLISEVKNVAQLSLTNQIQDFVAYAQKEGYTFELWTRESTKLSAPLQKLINNGTIVQKILEPK